MSEEEFSLERDITIGELVDINQQLDELESEEEPKKRVWRPRTAGGGTSGRDGGDRAGSQRAEPGAGAAGENGWSRSARLMAGRRTCSG